MLNLLEVASTVKEKYEDAIKRKGNPKQVALVTISERLKENFSFYTFEDTQEVYYYSEERGHYIPGGETLIAGNVQAILEHAGLKEIGSRYFAEEVVGHIKRSTFFNRAEFEESKDRLCLKNGVLDIKTGEFFSHGPDFRFLTRLEVEYVKGAECPKIKKFLKDVLRDEDLIIIEELAGYLLLRDNRFQIAFMFLGEGSNGKSVLLNILRSMLGEKNVACISLQELEENRFSLARIYQKHANIFPDLSSDALKGTGKFKILTGQDWLDAEVKFGGYIAFQNFAKLLFSANRLPYTDDKTGAFFRRWIFFEFPHTFEGGAENRNLLEELTIKEELSGLLNLALAGLARLLSQNQFSNSKSTEAKREDYIRRSDSVAAFAMDCLEQAIESETPKKRLWDEYLAYCGRQKITNLSERLFFTQLKKQWSMEETRPKVDGLRVQCVRGVHFKNMEKEEDLLKNGFSESNEEQKTNSEISQGCQGCQTLLQLSEEKNKQNGQGCQGCQAFSLSKIVTNLQEKEEGTKPDMVDMIDTDSSNIKIGILNIIPAFVGADGLSYGPFQPGDKATLPKNEANFLIEKNLARASPGGGLDA